MEHKYNSNPGISILLEHIEPGSGEKEVQALVENVLWTVFPASDHWLNLTKHRQGNTEPDNKTAKLIKYTAGWAPIDVLVGELKRIKEDTSMKPFARVSHDLLDDHMAESGNPDGSTLFGFVGIGKHVVFYERILPRGGLKPLHDQPLHWWDNAQTIQQWFDFFKTHIPTSLAAGPSATIPVSSPQAAPAAGSSAAVPVSSPQAAPAAGLSMAASLQLAEPSQEGLPPQYYFVRDSKYYFSDKGKVLSVARPKNEWVYNKFGWNETNRQKFWRLADGKDTFYK